MLKKVSSNMVFSTISKSNFKNIVDLIKDFNSCTGDCFENGYLTVKKIFIVSDGFGLTSMEKFKVGLYFTIEGCSASKIRACIEVSEISICGDSFYRLHINQPEFIKELIPDICNHID